MGLARLIDERRVGLDATLVDPRLGLENAIAAPPYWDTVGDDATEFDAEFVAGIGMGPRVEPDVRGMYIGEREEWVSRRKDTEGDTARRLDAVGYGSKRSSSERANRLIRCHL